MNIFCRRFAKWNGRVRMKHSSHTRQSGWKMSKVWEEEQCARISLCDSVSVSCLLNFKTPQVASVYSIILVYIYEMILLVLYVLVRLYSTKRSRQSSIRSTWNGVLLCESSESSCRWVSDALHCSQRTNRYIPIKLCVRVRVQAYCWDTRQNAWGCNTREYTL